jgi:biopolymer transport protein ExbD
MQKLSDSNDEGIGEVNITPLADVTLVLLIMIMVLSPMALQSMIQVQASQAVSAPSQQSITEKPIFVDITTAGFTLNNNPVATEYELFRNLQKILSSKSDKTVLISSAADVKYENVVRVLDMVRQSGAVSLSLVPRKGGSAS